MRNIMRKIIQSYSIANRNERYQALEVESVGNPWNSLFLSTA
jgi:hypothetical protein